MGPIEDFFTSPVITGKGRLARDLYLLGLLGEVVCLNLLTPVLTLSAVAGHMTVPVAFSSILILWTAGTLLVRRGHDFGLPGWATIAATIVWWVATFINPSNAYAHPRPEVALALGILSVLPFLLYGIVPGDIGRNAFGEGRRPPHPRKTDPDDSDQLLTLQGYGSSSTDQ